MALVVASAELKASFAEALAVGSISMSRLVLITSLISRVHWVECARKNVAEMQVKKVTESLQ